MVAPSAPSKKHDCVRLRMYLYLNQADLLSRWRRRDFERVGFEEKFQEHPSVALQSAEFNRPDAPYWMYQDTLLDMRTLAPVLEAAFAAAGVTKLERTRGSL